MGPNGSACKSTLSYVIAGKSDYALVTEGEVLLDGENIPRHPAGRTGGQAGVFSRFNILSRSSASRRHDVSACFVECAAAARRDEPELTTPDFIKRVRVAFRQARRRSGNAAPAAQMSGFPAAEKEADGNPADGPAGAASLRILDETDSGLDIDALRIVADGVNSLRSPKRGFLVITHYQRLLDYIVPDTVHIMSQGEIVKTGGADLAKSAGSATAIAPMRRMRWPATPPLRRSRTSSKGSDRS